MSKLFRCNVFQIPKRLIITANAVAEIADYQVFLKRLVLFQSFFGALNKIKNEFIAHFLA